MKNSMINLEQKEPITYAKLTKDNFSVYSLDEFIRHQEVKECWRKIHDEYVLVENAFTEDWDLEACRQTAKTILCGMDADGVAYGAFFENKVVGYIFLAGHLFGSRQQYLEVQLFHVSEPFRGKGIGRVLFEHICSEAKALGAKKLYISAHSSKESQEAYRKLGCVYATEVNRELVLKVPFDIQMEYLL